jgi:hypothetical protein
VVSLAHEIAAALADEIGPRRPTSRSEALAAEVVRGALAESGAAARIEPFAGFDSFAWSSGSVGAMAFAADRLPRRAGMLRAVAGAVPAALIALESGLVHTPLSDRLARRPSRNVVATIDPRGRAERTVCLMAHLDTSRSGVLFHPRLSGVLRRLLVAQAASVYVLAAEPLLGGSRPGRAALAAARGMLVAGLALLAEREVRGVDVPGANDNASGAGAVVQLGAECAESPLDGTRVVVLVSGCEEAGMLGARAFLDAHDTSGWLFLNFDGVAAPATLRYLPREGLGRNWPADPDLIRLADRVRHQRPELGLEPAVGPIGLTYDATVPMARGGRALTLVAGEREGIPNYHQPSDTVENLDPEVLERALEVGRELLARIDRGDADRA